jgi:hypothetical protein
VIKVLMDIAIHWYSVPFYVINILLCAMVVRASGAAEMFFGDNIRTFRPRSRPASEL